MDDSLIEEHEITENDIKSSPKKYGLKSVYTPNECRDAIRKYNDKIKERNKHIKDYSTIKNVLNSLSTEESELINRIRQCLINLVSTPVPNKIFNIIVLYEYYYDINDALLKYKDGDIIVMIHSVYVVCKNTKKFGELLDKIRKDCDIQNITQLLKSKSNQKLYFIIKSSTVDIDTVKKALIEHFGDKLKPEDINVKPYNQNEVFVVIESIWGSYDENSGRITELMKKDVIDNVKLQRQLKNDKLQIMYTLPPILPGLPPVNVEKQGITIIINSTVNNNINKIEGDHNQIAVDGTIEQTITKQEIQPKKKSKREKRAVVWIKKHPPKHALITVYYDMYKTYCVSKKKKHVRVRKFNKLMEEESYIRKRSNKGNHWILENDEGDDSSESDEDDE